jgi:N-acyl-D-aspartate/D-glutamate deacylase
VTWTSLLANKEAQKHKTSKKELDNMRALIARDLADAGLAGLSADRSSRLLTTLRSRRRIWPLPVRGIGS